MNKKVVNLLLGIGVIGICIIITCISLALIPSPSASPVATESISIAGSTSMSNPTAIILPTNTKEPAPTCSQIKEETDGMTDIQWESYKTQIVGKYILDWVGTVSDVGDAGFLTGYEYPIHLDVEAGCRLYVLVSDENFAMSLRKGDLLKVSGEISLLSELLGKVVYIDHPTKIEKP